MIGQVSRNEADRTQYSPCRNRSCVFESLDHFIASDTHRGSVHSIVEFGWKFAPQKVQLAHPILHPKSIQNAFLLRNSLYSKSKY